MALTPAQSAALASPCYLAGETHDPRFFPEAIRVGPDLISVKLTVNAGYE